GGAGCPKEPWRNVPGAGPPASPAARGNFRWQNPIRLQAVATEDGWRSPFVLNRSGQVPHFINTATFVASIFGSGEARRGSIPRSGAVTAEQRSQNRKATQPAGRRFFLAPTSLLTPYRPLKGMRVARASSGPKIPRRKRGRIYEMGYLVPGRLETGAPEKNVCKALILI